MSLKQEKTSNKNELKLTFTVEAAKFDEAIVKVYKKSAHYFNIPGFRKGKAPLAIVEKQYGSAIFYEDAFNEVFPEVYENEVKEAKIDVASRPRDIEPVQMEKGKDLIFTCLVDTKPEVKLGKYKGIEIEQKEYPVSDEDVQHELDHLAEHNSRLVSVEDRAAKENDTVTIDFDGQCEGEHFQGGKAEDYDLVLGSHSFISGFEDQVIGMKIGEEKDVNVTFPEDYFEKKLAGKPATFAVKVKAIKMKELPKIDDEFAKDVSEFDTLEDLKKDIKAKKAEQNDKRAQMEMEDEVLDKLIEASTMDVPKGMVDVEIDQMIEGISQRLQYQGLQFAQYLKMMGKTEEQAREEFRPEAEKNVKSRLVIEAVVEAEKIKADADHVKEHLEELAKQYGQKVEDLEKNEDVKDYFEKAVQNEEAVKFLVENAKKTAAKKEAKSEDSEKKAKKTTKK